jgi:ABC-type branched-subunit amino acid transport system substrate-binding protein
MSARALATFLAFGATSLVMTLPAPAVGVAEGRAAPEIVIRVATIGDFEANSVDNTAWLDAVRAGFAKANASGGLADASGRRYVIEVRPCNAASDSEQTIKCARQAVADGVVAVVGMSAVYSDQALPILWAAHIPALGVRVNGTADATHPASFPLASGFPAELMAMPQLLAEKGATKIAVIISDFGTATDEALATLEQGRRMTTAAAGPIVRVAPGTTDYAAAVTAATAPGVDGIVGILGGGPAGALARQLRASNYTGRYVTRAPWGNAPAASDADPSISGTLVVGQFPPPTSNDEGWKQLRRDMHEYDPQFDSFNEGTVNAWLATRAFEHVFGAVDLSLLSRVVLEPLVYSRSDDTRGFTPPLAGGATVAGLPRVYNPTVTFSVTRDGERLPLGGRFFDPFTGRMLH